MVKKLALSELVEGEPRVKAFLFDVSELKNQLWCLASQYADSSHFTHNEIDCLDALMFKAIASILSTHTTHLEVIELFKSELTEIFGYKNYNVQELVDVFFTHFANLLYMGMGAGIIPEYIKSFKIVGSTLKIEVI